jgi:murein DD-endopeptidase MepM/ murein hydrolase activator NlpD
MRTEEGNDFRYSSAHKKHKDEPSFLNDFVDPLHDELPLNSSEETYFGDYRGIDPYSGKDRWHVSIDRGGHLGQTIYAIAPGEVVEVGWGGSGPGNFVIIKHEYDDGNLYSVYFHFGRTRNDTGILVNVGDKVDTNTRIGTMGNSTAGTANTPCTMSCMAVHLHVEVRYEQNINLTVNESMLAGKRYSTSS